MEKDKNGVDSMGIEQILTEIRADFKEVKQDVRETVGALRQQMRDDLQDLKSDLLNRITALDNQIAETAKQYGKDHDLIIQLEERGKTLVKEFDTFKKDEKIEGKKLSDKIGEIYKKLDRMVTHSVKEEKAILKDQNTIWRTIAKWAIGIASGAGGMAGLNKLIGGS